MLTRTRSEIRRYSLGTDKVREEWESEFTETPKGTYKIYWTVAGPLGVMLKAENRILLERYNMKAGPLEENSTVWIWVRLKIHQC